MLLGTPTVEGSEMFSAALTEAGIAHNVLSARQHEREALTLAQAGAPGAVTIATSMAGRGTDIGSAVFDFAVAEAIKDEKDPKAIEKITAKLRAEIDTARS